jgi:hypothetical protein
MPRSQESRHRFAIPYRLTQKNLAKERKRPPALEARRGAELAPTRLTAEPEASAGAFRQHSLLALTQCLYARQAPSRPLSRAAWPRSFPPAARRLAMGPPEEGRPCWGDRPHPQRGVCRRG